MMTVSGVSPAAIAAAVAEARGFLRLEGEAEQALLERLAATAIALAEAFTGTLLVTRTVEDVLPAARGGGWQLLAAAPVRAIGGVMGLPAEGAPFVLPPDGYAVDVDGAARGWVRVIAPGAAGRVAVSYTAGLAVDWDALPPPIAQGVAMLIAHLFNDRDVGRAPPAAVAALWRPYRRMRLMAEAHP
ncbi:head-tail connector protein [Sphingomonas panaciterrae]|uniref:head-tail connector protein n=1 Tax=Sphingomonas panaciterrae TaxID=1462999 RepID=UPI002FEECEED